MPHAGETAGPESIWGALRSLGAKRIGHGVRAVEDPELVEFLVQHRIPLEVSPTSNIRLGVYPDYGAHPLPGLHGAGAIVTVNSDDPVLFNTTLNDEVALLAGPLGLSVTIIDEILLKEERASCSPDAARRRLRRAVTAQTASQTRAVQTTGDEA